MLKQEMLTEPLRTPPSVSAEVEKSECFARAAVYGYTAPASPLPCGGPAPRYLYHSGPGHTATEPWYCHACGMDVAKLLIEVLRVGTKGEV